MSMAHAARSPVTLTAVRAMSRIRSTPMIKAMPSAGTPTWVKIVDRMTMPTPGVLGEPMEAPTVVRIIGTKMVPVISIP